MYFFNFQHPIIVRDFNFFFHLHKWTHKLAEESVKKSFWVKVRVILERLNWSSPCSPAAAKNVGDVKKLKKKAYNQSHILFSNRPALSMIAALEQNKLFFSAAEQGQNEVLVLAHMRM